MDHVIVFDAPFLRESNVINLKNMKLLDIHSIVG